MAGLSSQDETASNARLRVVRVLINPLAGSVPADAREVIEPVLTDHGVDAHFEIMDQDCEAVCERMRGQSADAIIVWGGDGTLACALNILGPDAPPILPLAGGTMNMLPRMVHDEIEDRAACLQAVLSAPSLVTLNAGEVEGRRFYVGALLGGLTRLAGPRESLRKADIVKAVTEFSEADAFSLDTPMRYHPSAAPDATAQALGIFLSDTAHKPGFDILATAPESLLDLAMTGLSGLLDDWRQAAGVERLTAREVDVEALESTGIEATLDGEPVTLPRKIRFELIEGAARILAARKA